MKKFLWIILVFASLAVFTSCLPAGGGGGGGGGNVFIGDELVSGAGAGQQAATAPGGTTAPAQPQEQPEGIFGGMAMFLPIILMVAVMYLFIIRPQRKQAKAAKEMQEGLRVGENVITTSGFFGKIVGVGTDAFLIEFGEGRGIKVWVRKSDIAGVKSPVMTPPPKDDTKEIEEKK